MSLWRLLDDIATEWMSKKKLNELAAIDILLINCKLKYTQSTSKFRETKIVLMLRFKFIFLFK